MEMSNESLLVSFDVIKDYQGGGTDPDHLDAPIAIASVSLTSSIGNVAALTEVAKLVCI
jgi:hypothetical protein